METDLLIALEEFCTVHNIEISFIYSLQQSGLIEIIKIRDASFIEADHLYQLEKFVRLYYDLDINLEGIETINYLLERISSMQHEINSLRNKLRVYEDL
jgi:hypothetical protein